MLVSFATKKPIKIPPLPPMDFYRFRHRVESVHGQGNKMLATRPLWVVGVSPFDTIIREDEGYVVHLKNPQFTARWTMNEETIEQIKSPDFYDEDFNITIYETIFMDESDNIERIQEWLLEAACAVAYTKGLIAIVDPEEMH